MLPLFEHTLPYVDTSCYMSIISLYFVLARQKQGGLSFKTDLQAMWKNFILQQEAQSTHPF